MIKSDYHFDSDRMDPRWDNIVSLGNLDFVLTAHEIQDLIKDRITTGKKLGTYGDLDQIDVTKNYSAVDPEIVLVSSNSNLPPVLQKITDLFAFEKPLARVLTQLPGEMWNLHIDKLQKYCDHVPDTPEKIMRLSVHLSDWEPGHFWSYGNHTHSHWKFGDVHTFDWMHVPHCTANAGLIPRLSLNITGIATKRTELFLQQLKNSSSYRVNGCFENES